MAERRTDPSARPPASRTWLVVALALLALRLPGGSGPMSDPHVWRQLDTHHVALDFHRHGIDLFHPAVTWLGDHRTIILNFPITEALSALLYRAFGPDPWWDRMVSLAFFVVATLYLLGLARRLMPERAARLATLAWLAFPLGQYFSFVPHIEFTVIAGVNGFAYHGVRALTERSWRHAAGAALAGALAALVKGPYLAVALAPLALLLLRTWSWGNAARAALALAVPVAAFLWWRGHADAVNARVPDWTFLPDFYKEVNPLWRWMGTLAERQDPDNWFVIARRLWREVATPLGVAFAAAALLHPAPPGEGDAPGVRRAPLGARPFLAASGLALAFHVAFFFRLNLWHNYYQVPFLAPAALAVGLGADLAWRRLPRLGPLPLGAAAFALFLALAAWAPWRLGYRWVDWVRIEAAKRAAQIVPPGGLVVASDVTTLPPTDPRLLARMDRYGWPMRAHEITAERLARLRAYGARWVVVVRDDARPDVAPPAFLGPALAAHEPVLHAGRRIGELWVYDLDRGGWQGGGR
uniref:Glycosyltransferase RgtA/B/C/D-like domain-containing protein n=1 Tax=Eiseniibacteriota bacterium TaxID=2212470 RepID=A0A832I1U8_UNCEI